MLKYLVEYLGTFFFLFVILYVGNAIAIGAALAIVILVGGKISGGHYNPAVSIMLASAGKLPGKEVVPYIISQVAGGLSALALYKLVAHKK
jgi:aquaporin Z